MSHKDGLRNNEDAKKTNQLHLILHNGATSRTQKILNLFFLNQKPQ